MTNADAPRTLETPVQGLWIGSSLSAMEQLSLSSFLANGHSYHLYVYEPVANVPEGVVVKDAEAIVPRSRAFQYTGHATWAGFANSFRYRLLLERGGWWADTDLICLKPFDLPETQVFSSEYSARRQRVNIGAIKVPPGTELMQFMWDESQKKDPAKLVWGETGPTLMKQGVRRFSLERFVKPWTVFCPVGYKEWRSLIAPDAPELPDESVAVHLWHEMWRAAGQDKNAHYHPASLYEQLRRRFLGASDRISVERVRSMLTSLPLEND